MAEEKSDDQLAQEMAAYLDEKFPTSKKGKERKIIRLKINEEARKVMMGQFPELQAILNESSMLTILQTGDEVSSS